MTKDGKIYCASCKKYLEKVDSIPENAQYYDTHSGYVTGGTILKDERKGYTLYHTHKVGGSNGRYSMYGAHEVFIVKAE